MLSKVIFVFILFFTGKLNAGIQTQEPKCCKDFPKKEEKTTPPQKKINPPRELKPSSKTFSPTIQGITEQVLREERPTVRLENIRSNLRNNSSLQEVETDHEKLKSLNPLVKIKDKELKDTFLQK